MNVDNVSNYRLFGEQGAGDPGGNRTTQRPPDHRKQTQTAVVWSCLPFIRSGQTILQGTVKGGRRQGRQRKRWEDNIRKWASPEFGKSQRAVENREKWRELVAKLSVCPNDPRAKGIDDDDDDEREIGS